MEMLLPKFYSNDKIVGFPVEIVFCVCLEVSKAQGLPQIKHEIMSGLFPPFSALLRKKFQQAFKDGF